VNHEAKQLSDRPTGYEQPTVVDYGSLLELTLAAGSPNADAPTGTNNAYPNYSPS
jgi:hypothetical protein